MRYEAAEVSANNAVPCRTLLCVELFLSDHHYLASSKPYLSLDVLRNVLGDC